jgi:NADH:ubiquinone oxidoreductase subunit E
MTEPKQIDWKQLQAIVDTHRGLTWALIPLLQEVQEAFGYIPPESIEPIAAALSSPWNRKGNTWSGSVEVPPVT